MPFWQWNIQCHPDQYCACWCYGSLGHHVISRHSNDFVRQTCFCLFRQCLYKIMFILPVLNDHLSREATKFSGRFMHVLLYSLCMFYCIFCLKYEQEEQEQQLTDAKLRADFERISLGKFTDRLSHWGRDKMAAKFLTTISDAFSWLKIYKFQLRFHRFFS